MSRIASMVAQMNITMPLFSLVFFVGNALFLLVAFISLLRLSCQSKSDFDSDSLNEDADDFELVSLLGRP